MTKIKQYISETNWKKFFIILLTIWFGVNLLQAIFTEIMDDEAYYALFGERLAWGYFDHPPMVGLMTFISDFLFNGNMSVRFLTILFQIFTIILIWKLLEESAPNSNKVALFFIITASMIMFATYGFVTAPDVPLLFFTTLFLYAYQRFLTKESWLSMLLLAISMAGMIYSKYHAFIIIGLVLLSNFKLIKSYKAWVAVVLMGILLVPHINWQFEMDFPTFKYHLVGRSFGFQWDEFLGHFPNQLAVFNPFTLGAVIYVLIKYKPQTLFEKALYFQIIGFQLFFFFMAFRGYVQPHWTAPTTMAMIILLYRASLKNEKLLRYVKNWVAPSILLLIVMRIFLVTDLLPSRLRFSGKEITNKNIESVVGELPLVFTGSFQRSSTYQYFTKKEAILLSGVNSRLTQFDLWQKELDYQGKSVFILADIEGRSQEYIVDDTHFKGFVTNNLQTVNRLKIEYTLTKEEASTGNILIIDFKIENPCNFDVNFNHSEFPVKVKSVYTKRRQKNIFECELNESISIIPAKGSFKGTLKTVVPDLVPDDYQFTLTLDNTICPAINSYYVPLKITK